MLTTYEQAPSDMARRTDRPRRLRPLEGSDSSTCHCGVRTGRQVVYTIPYRSPASAVAELLWLAVLVTIGWYAGGIFARDFLAHNPHVAHELRIGPRYAYPLFVGLWMYLATAPLVGFGLLNRILRGSMVVVPLGSVLGAFFALIFSFILGIVATPAVIVWRVWRVALLFDRD